jgi:phage-related protein
MIRKIIYYKDYFTDFYSKQNRPVQEKIEYVFKLIKQVDRIPKKFFQHLTSTDGLYEIRVEYQSNIYRIFCFFDKGQMVVLVNGFQKKSQKTPAKEIKLAEKLKKEYFNNKIK